MPNQRMFPIEERLSRVEAQAIVGADQAAGLLSLIRFVESDLRACADRRVTNVSTGDQEPI